MPGDFASKLGDTIEFSGEQAPSLAPGTYQGVYVGPDVALGSNGMNKSWHIVQIVGGAYDGQHVRVSIEDAKASAVAV